MFASVPIGKEVRLLFKPDKPDCYKFYLPDVKWEKTNISSSRIDFVAGKVAELNLEVSVREKQQESFTISSGITPSSRYYKLILTIHKDTNKKKVREAVIEINENPFKFQWVAPEELPSQLPSGVSGVSDRREIIAGYEFRLEGHSVGRCEYIWSEGKAVTRR